MAWEGLCKVLWEAGNARGLRTRGASPIVERHTSKYILRGKLHIIVVFIVGIVYKLHEESRRDDDAASKSKDELQAFYLAHYSLPCPIPAEPLSPILTSRECPGKKEDEMWDAF